MAHFAELSEDGMVLRVLVISNDVCLDENGLESEEIGIDFCVNNFGLSRWIQTSYNANFRFRYAQVGGFYDPELDIFIPPKPFSKWILNQERFDWEPPIPYPGESGKDFAWNDEDGQWVIL